ncbi:Vgb family protein [Actinoplanes siamensis]|uniref:Virginiamycin B lyase n=1 Tax=Actinoplanes siamensis TaxID=1223317 RepID=A0A919N6Y1_9ACTN|nr:hydrolase [Actinoplanes siamensis]GIF05477.1 virginiamycin B lyase [Actinoplanes siamensis]
MEEVVLPAGWAPYAVTGDAAGTVWTTILNPAGLGSVTSARVVGHEALAGQPMQLAAGADAALWYTCGDDRIGRRDASGAHTTIDLAPGSAPYGIAAAPDGDIWFTASGTNQIGRITARRTITMMDLPLPGSRPAMITVDSSGTAWAALNGAGALARVRGEAVEIVELPGGAAPVGVTAAPDGVWYADIAGGCTGRVDHSGVVEWVPFEDSGCRPHAVAADPGGGCWVTLWGSGELARVTAGCVITVQKLPGNEPHGLWVSPTHVWVAMESGSLVVCPRSAAG